MTRDLAVVEVMPWRLFEGNNSIRDSLIDLRSHVVYNTARIEKYSPD